MRHHILGLRREADNERRPLWPRLRNRSQDVGILSQSQRRRTFPFHLFDLLRERSFDPPIGDRSREHGNIGRKRCAHGFEHLGRCLDAHDLNAVRLQQRNRSRNQCHPRTEIARRSREFKPLLSRRSVREVANRIDGLMRWPARDHHMPPGKDVAGACFWFERVFDCFDELLNLDETAQARFAALSHFADGRTDEANAIFPELRHIPLRRCIEPHRRVHRWRHQNRLVSCKQHGRRKVVGVPACHSRHEIRRCRCDHDQVAVTRQSDMSDLALLIEIEEIGQHPFIRQRPDGQRRHELVRSLRHDCTDAMPTLFEPADQFQTLIGRDTASDDQEDAFG